MKIIKKIFKQCDYFGVGFNFHYKAVEKYHTPFGGFIFVLFILFAICYFLYNLISFIQKKDLDIIYYKTQLPVTDKINFLNYSLVNAFNIQCNSNKIIREKELELFDFEVNYFIYNQNEGTYIKEKITLNYSLCNTSNFFNKFNDSFQIIGLNQKYCLNDNNITIEGTLTDKLFKYIEINLKMKIEDYETYNNFLNENDCYFQLYHTDYGINIKNYSYPINSFIRESYLYLNAKNLNNLELLFGVKEFASSHQFFFFKKMTEYYISYIGENHFNIYKGKKRFLNKLKDYNILAKIIIKAEPSKYIIQRQYQMIIEFIGNLASILSNIILILVIIVGKINTFYSYQSLMKKLFLFRDIRNSKSLKLLSQMTKKIKDCNFSSSSDIKISNTINKINNYVSSRPASSNFMKYSFLRFKTPITSRIKKTNENLQSNESSLDSINDNLEINQNNNLIKIKRVKDENENDNNNNNNNNNNNIYINTTKVKEKIKHIPKKILIKFSVLDIIILKIFPCLANKELRMNQLLFQKGKYGIYYQLDILNYMRNMTALDILIYSLLEPYQMKMLKFVSKPSISVANQINTMQQFKQDFNVEITEDEIRELLEQVKIIEQKKNNRTNVEKKLCEIVNVELENLLVQ